MYVNKYKPINPFDDDTSVTHGTYETPTPVSGLSDSYDPYFMHQRGDTLDPHAAYMNSLNNTPADVASTGLSSGEMNAIGGGIQAGGQTIGTLASIIAQQRARQQGLENAGLEREGNMQLAKLRLQAAQEMADKERSAQMRAFLAQTLARGGDTAIRNWDIKRAANKAGSSLIAQAFFG